MIKIKTIDGSACPFFFCDYSGEPIDDPAMANVIWLEDDRPNRNSHGASVFCHVFKQFDFPQIRAELLGQKDGQTCCWMGLDVFLATLLQNCNFDSKSAESALRRKRKMSVFQI
jgi:hypothetical protein